MDFEWWDNMMNACYLYHATYLATHILNVFKLTEVPGHRTKGCSITTC